MSEVIALPSLRKRLLSGGIWAFAGRAGGTVFALATNALLARLLPPSEVGAYFLAASIVTGGCFLAQLGLNTAVVRLVAESMALENVDRVRRVISLVFSIGIVGTIAVGSIYFLFGEALVRKLFDASSLASVSSLVALWIVLSSMQGLLAETFRGFSDIRLAVLLLNFTGVVTAGFLVASLAVVWYFIGSVSLSTVILFAIAASAISLVLAAITLHRKLSRLAAGTGRGTIMAGEVWGVSWPLLTTNMILVALAYADLWIVGAFLSQEDVALYGAALRTVLLVAAPLVIAEAVMPPIIAELNAQGRTGEMERTLRVVAMLAGIPASAVLFGFVVVGGPLLGLVFGSFYVQAGTVLAIISCGQFVVICAGLSFQTLAMTGNQVVAMFVTIISGIVSIVGAFLVVERFGITGVAVTTALGNVTYAVLSVLATRWRVGVWTLVGPGAVADGVNVLKSLRSGFRRDDG